MTAHRAPVLLMVVLLLSGCAIPAGFPGGSPAQPPTATAVTVGDIHISDAWVRVAGSAIGSNAAAYLSLRNTGDAADRLVGAGSDAAEAVELHTTTQDGDVMRMQPVEAIEVPAGGEVALRPGSDHIMLIGLSQPLSPGDTIPLMLVFEHAGQVEIQVEARQP